MSCTHGPVATSLPELLTFAAETTFEKLLTSLTQNLSQLADRHVHHLRTGEINDTAQLKF